MRSNRILWRIDEVTSTTALDQERLASGLRLHVAHSPLTTVAMRIGARRQCYLILDGCAGCLTGQCRMGCRAALFRRLFDACVSGGALRAVAPPQGLARRPYQCGVFGWPGPNAETLDTTLLHGRDEARLIVHWRRDSSQIQAGALLFTSPPDPDPTTALAARGWRVLRLPPALMGYLGKTALPPALPFGAVWRAPLTLLLPALTSDSAVGARADASNLPQATAAAQVQS